MNHEEDDVDEVLERCSTYYGCLSRSQNRSSPSGNYFYCSMKNERLPRHNSDPLTSLPPERKSTLLRIGSRVTHHPGTGAVE